MAGEQTAPGCVAQAIGDKVFDGSFFDSVDFSFSDALALKWYDTYCNSSQDEVQSVKEQLGVIIDRSQAAIEYRQNRREQKRYNRSATQAGKATVEVDPFFNPEGKLSELYNTAKEQAYERLKIENDPLSLICVGEAGPLSFTGNVLLDLKVCGLEAALTQAITCLLVA